MKRIVEFLVISAFVGLGNMVPGSALAAADDDSRCRALVGGQFLSLVDAPTQINQARLSNGANEIVQDLAHTSVQIFGAAAPEVLAETQRSLAGLQPFCHVSGYVLPNVRFELLLPVSHWNGKFLHVGCGGWCGYNADAVHACAIHSDYACISTDMGHPWLGGLWFRNNLQAQIDFSYRATHVATVAGKAIVEHYYGSAPKRSYFIGVSTGGYQAMVEAQRYPWDFNGIVAGAPDMDESDLAVRGLWIKRNFLDASGKPVELQAGHAALNFPGRCVCREH